MYIQSLGLKSFRSFRDIDLPIDAPRVGLFGLNGTGKTTIKSLIQYVLRARCQGLDDRGSGQEKLVPTFGELGVVAAGITLKDIGTVERTWSTTGTSLRVTGFTGDSRAQQTALLDRLETTDPFLQACLDSRQFLRLHHADAKALVLALLNVRIKLEGDTEVYTLAQIDEMYDEAFEARKIAKKQLQAHVLPQKPLDTGKPLVADVDAKLAIRRQELEEALSSVGQGSGQRLMLQRRLNALSVANPMPVIEGGLQALEAKISDLDERLGIMEADADTPDEIAVKQGWDDDGVKRLAFLRSSVEALKTHKPKEGCVLDPEVECPVPKQRFTKRAQAIEAEIEAMPQADAVDDDEPPVVDPRTAVRRELQELEKVRQRYEQALGAEQRRVRELAEVKDELSSLQDTTAQEAVIADLRAKIAKGEAIRADAAAHWKAVDGYQKALEARQGLVQEVERLEALCSTLGPSGIRVQALGSAMGTFEGAVNEFTKPYGWTVSFQLDPWGVTVNGRWIDTYSESEQYRIGVAIQLAIAMLSGLRFAIVDELDLLDAENRNLLAKMILNSPLDQVIMCGKREAKEPIPNIPSLMVSYRLAKDGDRTIVMERQG